MSSLLESVAVGALVFASTNADDLVILAALFADERVHARAVVAGQFLGIGALTAISAAAAFGAKTLPAAWVALLGLVPLGLGLSKLLALRAPATARDEPGDEAEPEQARAACRRWSGSASIR